MSLYSANITITNNSPDVLVLDAAASSGLGNGNWPLLIAAGASAVVHQTGNVRLDFTAEYAVGGDQSKMVSLHFYLAVFGLGYVHMSMVGTGVRFGSDSSITLFDQNALPTPDTNNTTLNISAGPNWSVSSGEQQMSFIVGQLG